MKIDPKYKAVCFDMDGTLLDTKVDYQLMSNLVFDEMVKIGVPEEVIDREEGYKFNIESGVEYLRAEGRMDEVYAIAPRIAKIARDVEMERVGEARPFPKADKLLRKLRDMGLRTGLLTRGCREYAEAAVKICGVSDLLDSIVARDDYPENEAKPSPVAMKHIADKVGVGPEEILFFGDHIFDYQCARDAGSGFVAVLTGTYTKADWMDVPGIEIFDSVGDYYDNLD